ncbi:ABC transporter permease [Gordonibacter sp. Marseille-P4307]|uniref:ABC transporter permease n=1 Tax=Gordonibacter sp. Marseille-P4307 TaxID=2161815 RepID=UPI000F536385|nr:ABC transporter permease [Gordonibacter sp. Marseille-P4307]
MQAIEQNQMKKNLFILRTLVTKDFKLKYRRSVLGVLWSVLNPLLMMVVLSAVFSFMFRFTIENFPLYLILGTILFNLMADSTNAAMHSITGAAPLIKKIRIEKLIFPLESVVFQIVNFVISLAAVVLVMLYFSITPTVNLLALPLLIFYVLVFSLGLGMLLAALAVFFRDVMHLWGVVITAWTYATPLFYPVDMLDGWMKTVMSFNPMYHYVTYFRSIVMWDTMPDLVENLVCLGIALITFLVGFIVFRKSENKFILYI